MTATTTTREPAYFLIGDVARAAGVATETIRRWHRENVLPAPGRTPNGLRVYSAADLEVIQRLRAQRAANARHGGDVAD